MLRKKSKHSPQALQIAIDGPVASGKSVVARILADQLKMTYIDTGAMYRSVALAAQRAGVDWHNGPAVTQVARQANIRLARPIGDKKDGRPASVYLNDQDVSWKIRELEYGEGASIVGTHPEVRTILVRRQQELCEGKRVVMEGRDIGIKVLPQADLKIFITADRSERVSRRLKQFKKAGKKVTKKEIQADIVSRDTREMTREIDPLRPTLDAWQLDTTTLSIKEVVDVICQRVLNIKSEAPK